MTKEQLKSMTKKELEKIYSEMYNEPARKSAKKDDLINTILNRYRILSRAKAFREGIQ